MDLFDSTPIAEINLLPQDGTVNYFGKLLNKEESDDYLNILLNTIDWKNDEAIIFGKRIITKRKVAWYGSQDFDYTYSGVTKKALAWTPELQSLRTLIEQTTGETFNSCLLNLYHTGEEGMGWHSDGEKALKKNGAIASISFGAERKFAFKHKKTNEVIPIILQHGSLLIMKDTTQTHWLHRLPPTKTVSKPRVNLTFRTIDITHNS
jgi:alkylated DNA repair dioxygenase AlkB